MSGLPLQRDPREGPRRGGSLGARPRADRVEDPRQLRREVPHVRQLWRAPPLFPRVVVDEARPGRGVEDRHIHERERRAVRAKGEGPVALPGLGLERAADALQVPAREGLVARARVRAGLLLRPGPQRGVARPQHLGHRDRDGVPAPPQHRQEPRELAAAG
eukprot:CAMPEP_0168503514 /NCGR_PEP_ID=MMETSP0228-20121227/75900_1 /TAXON_ID=133427 /ORGANISM="Protoceratium reticulatum, Strain CCCM 535 (=CCMP 1889)" /LENGTH=160 /DNA_ID=CAMNT_0008520583 /DNA_START=3 /DNA_END=482 /DNA_ORIENTATION=-